VSTLYEEEELDIKLHGVVLKWTDEGIISDFLL